MEGGVFSFELTNSFLELVTVFFFGGFYLEGKDGIGDEHGGTIDHIAHISFTEGVPSRAFEPKYGKNLARSGFLNVLHVIGMHFHHSGHFESFLDSHIVNIITFFEFSLIHPHISQLTEFVLFQLEGVAYKRLLVFRQEH
jgi:hypothetical protein